MRIRIERVAPSSGAFADPTGLFARCREIRRRVFVDEQSIPPQLEWDGLDSESEHFAALAGRPPELDALGTARLRFFEAFAKAERVAVLPSARKLGVGRRLMEAIEDRVRTRGLHEIRLNAQLTVVPFYERLGYTGQGAVFLEAGIEHLAMSKALD